MNSEVKVIETTRMAAGSCYDCSHRGHEDYKVYSIFITTPNGITMELRYCQIHTPAFLASFKTAVETIHAE